MNASSSSESMAKIFDHSICATRLATAVVWKCKLKRYF